MTFGKDQNSQDCRECQRLSRESIRKNGLPDSFHKIRSEISKKLWEDPKYREKGLKSLEKARKSMNQSEAGKKSRYYEQKIAKNIQADKIYLPSEVCDRIAIRNGEIFFIEIKRKGQRLRPKQKEFKEIAKEKYEILYG